MPCHPSVLNIRHDYLFWTGFSKFLSGQAILLSAYFVLLVENNPSTSEELAISNISLHNFYSRSPFKRIVGVYCTDNRFEKTESTCVSCIFHWKVNLVFRVFRKNFRINREFVCTGHYTGSSSTERQASLWSIEINKMLFLLPTPQKNRK